MFNEKTHAFIPATFYKQLASRFSARGKDAFIFATNKYGEQRGSRMAQRVLRDGKNLDFKNYNIYGEWNFTSDDNHILKNISTSPDYNYEVHKCPWHDQFEDMNAIDGACVYCTYLDKAISRGYNPDLIFDVNKILHKDGYCDFVQKNAYISENDDLTKDAKNILPWLYHCADIFYTFKRISESIFGEEGRIITKTVEDKLERSYGSEMLKEIHFYKTVDFSIYV